MQEHICGLLTPSLPASGVSVATMCGCWRCVLPLCAHWHLSSCYWCVIFSGGRAFLSLQDSDEPHHREGAHQSLMLGFLVNKIQKSLEFTVYLRETEIKQNIKNECILSLHSRDNRSGKYKDRSRMMGTGNVGNEKGDGHYNAIIAVWASIL